MTDDPPPALKTNNNTEPGGNKSDRRLVSPFSIPNIRRYIAFKVLFNSRFYYPVFTVLFLDFGLTVAQFSILNAVWAATIVMAEVPSGALADTIGRKRLLVFSTMAMVVEVGIISFVPVSNPSLVFWVFLLNRILSGLAEAAASGADEALAYDALKLEGNCDDWGRVLEVLARFQSLGFIIAMTAGAALYDPVLMEKGLNFLGFSIALTQESTMRFPLYATLALSLFACWSCLGMEDTAKPAAARSENRIQQLKTAFSLTFSAGGWILRTPFVLGVILFGMLFDGIIRMVITLASQYYRMIDLPESLFGIIGAMVALLGLFIPRIARKVAENMSPGTAVWITSALTLSGLASMALFLPWAGIFPALITFSAMYFNGFFVSYYINKETPSGNRATVLSFKGLFYNLVYGILGMGYALVLKTKTLQLEKNMGKGQISDLATSAGVSQTLDNLVFKESFWGFPLVFLMGFALLLAFHWFFLKTKTN